MFLSAPGDKRVPGIGALLIDEIGVGRANLEATCGLKVHAFGFVPERSTCYLPARTQSGS